MTDDDINEAIETLARACNVENRQRVVQALRKLVNSGGDTASMSAENRGEEAVGEVIQIGNDVQLKEVSWRKGKLPPVGSKLYLAPRHASEDVRDAERYRWLRDQNKRMHYTTDYAPEGCFDLIQIEVRVIGEPVFTKEGHFDFAFELDRAIDEAKSKPCAPDAEA